MGNYNSHYESYYAKILQRRNSSNYYNNNNKKTVESSILPKLDKEYFYKRIIRDFVGVLILFIMVLGCKVLSTPKTIEVYNYSKELVSHNINYKLIYGKVMGINLEEIKETMENWVGDLRLRLTGKKTIKEEVQENYLWPAKGEITSGFGKRKDPFSEEVVNHYGVDIDLPENSEIKASYKGKVKDSGEDKFLGKFITITHGDGIETKYGHLNEILVKNEDMVEKGQVIGKSGNTGKSTAPHLHFELIYMGQNKDPMDYIDEN